MTATKILSGQIPLVSMIVLATIWAATQWTAWRLGFQPCILSCVKWLAYGLIGCLGGSQLLDASYLSDFRTSCITRQKHTGAKRMGSPFYTAEHEAYREVVRRFVEKEIEPYAHEWDEAGGFPRVLYEKAAEIGLLGLGFPEEYGGAEADRFMWIVAVQELARAGAGGISASLESHSIGAPPIARAGSPEFKARVLPEILMGRKISALAIPSRAAAPTSPIYAPPRAATATSMW
jgi:alkylation response protein AidB-like acyl-CoA dehydrogenase